MSCEYCDGLEDQSPLMYKNNTMISIDKDKKKLWFEHTTFRYTTQYDPYSGDEDVLYREFDIEYCPKCGGKL